MSSVRMLNCTGCQQTLNYGQGSANMSITFGSQVPVTPQRPPKQNRAPHDEETPSKFVRSRVGRLPATPFEESSPMTPAGAAPALYERVPGRRALRGALRVEFTPDTTYFEDVENSSKMLLPTYTFSSVEPTLDFHLKAKMCDACMLFSEELTAMKLKDADGPSICWCRLCRGCHLELRSTSVLSGIYMPDIASTMIWMPQFTKAKFYATGHVASSSTTSVTN